MSDFDYGEYNGAGSDDLRPVPKRIEAGLKRGSEKDFMAFLKLHNDALADVASSDRKTFNPALNEWVRKRLERDIEIPECIDWHWKNA